MKLSEVRFAVVDTETTGLEPKTDHVVQVGIFRRAFGFYRSWSYEVTIKPPVTIPPLASAVHHLTDRHVKHCESILYHKEAIIKEVEGADVLVAHNAQFDSAFLPFLEGPWLCTKRLAQHLWMDEAESFSNQYLRYWLRFNLDPGPAHSALADAKVTAAVLERAIDVYLVKGHPNDLDALLSFAASPIRHTKFNFGKYKDEPIWEVVKKDRQYVGWCLNKMQDLDEDMRQSLIIAIREA